MCDNISIFFKNLEKITRIAQRATALTHIKIKTSTHVLQNVAQRATALTHIKSIAENLNREILFVPCYGMSTPTNKRAYRFWKR